MLEIFRFITHIDHYLSGLLLIVGGWIYPLLFLVIFVETGLVVMPFLPGDSLLFAVGALSSGGYIHIGIAYLVMLVAAILGDSVNYWIGHRIGDKVSSPRYSRFFKKEYLEKTHVFYEKHGKKTIILARFVPIVRTFAPFVAGVGKMEYRTFFLFNVIGAFSWVTLLLFAGYFFGGLPFVQKNFEYVVLGIIIISLLPVVFEYVKHKLSRR